MPRDDQADWSGPTPAGPHRGRTAGRRLHQHVRDHLLRLR